MDNQCRKAIDKYIRSTKATIQLFNPDNHRVNAAERTIQTWKEHWLSGMGTLDLTCPIQLWCQFLEQGQDTLNLLRISRVNPKLSAYAVLEGQFNFDRTPMAPVGTRALILLDPNKRNTWQSHAINAWHVGPAKQHYHNYHFFIPETKGYCIPKHTKMPAIEPGDTLRLTAQDLIKAIQTLSKAPIDLNPQHMAALCQLADIFNSATQNDNSTTRSSQMQTMQTHASATRVNTHAPVPRVNTPSTSADPTASKTLLSQHHIHQRHTRNNMPMPTWFEESRQGHQRIRRCDQHRQTSPIIHQPCPQNSISQYHSKQLAQQATPPPKPAPTVNYIRQDDDNETNMLKSTNLILHSTTTPCNITHFPLHHIMQPS